VVGARSAYGYTGGIGASGCARITIPSSVHQRVHGNRGEKIYDMPPGLCGREMGAVKKKTDMCRNCTFSPTRGSLRTVILTDSKSSTPTTKGLRPIRRTRSVPATRPTAQHRYFGTTRRLEEPNLGRPHLPTFRGNDHPFAHHAKATLDTTAETAALRLYVTNGTTRNLIGIVHRPYPTHERLVTGEPETSNFVDHEFPSSVRPLPHWQLGWGRAFPCQSRSDADCALALPRGRNWASKGHDAHYASSPLSHGRRMRPTALDGAESFKCIALA